MKRNIIFLHGFTHNSKFFEPLKNAFKKENGDCKIYSPDFYGRGDEEVLERAREYNYETYTQQVLELVEGNNINEINCLLGSSMGGLVAMMVAKAKPHLVKKLILNDVGAQVSKLEIARVGSYIKSDNFFDVYEDAFAALKKEFKECGLSLEELNYIADNYIIEVSDEILEGREAKKYKLNYDYKIAEAFWRRDKQIKIPDLDFSELWEEMIKKNPDIEIIIFRGEKSNFLSHEHLQDMMGTAQVRKSVEFKNCGHLPMFLGDSQIKLAMKHI